MSLFRGRKKINYIEEFTVAFKEEVWTARKWPALIIYSLKS